MTLAAATTRDDYVATSGQTVFPYTFTALVDSDVEVLQNGIALTWAQEMITRSVE